MKQIPKSFISILFIILLTAIANVRGQSVTSVVLILSLMNSLQSLAMVEHNLVLLLYLDYMV